MKYSAKNMKAIICALPLNDVFLFWNKQMAFHELKIIPETLLNEDWLFYVCFFFNEWQEVWAMQAALD